MITRTVKIHCYACGRSLGVMAVEWYEKAPLQRCSDLKPENEAECKRHRSALADFWVKDWPNEQPLYR